MVLGLADWIVSWLISYKDKIEPCDNFFEEEIGAQAQAAERRGQHPAGWENPQSVKSPIVIGRNTICALTRRLDYQSPWTTRSASVRCEVRLCHGAVVHQNPPSASAGCR
jgi:hypothetical protein